MQTCRWKKWRRAALTRRPTANVVVAHKAAAATELTLQAALLQSQANARLTQPKGFDPVAAPFDGVISSRGADIGTLLTTGTNRPLLFRLTVHAAIPQGRALWRPV